MRGRGRKRNIDKKGGKIRKGNPKRFKERKKRIPAPGSWVGEAAQLRNCGIEEFLECRHRKVVKIEHLYRRRGGGGGSLRVTSGGG